LSGGYLPRDEVAQGGRIGYNGGGWIQKILGPNLKSQWDTLTEEQKEYTRKYFPESVPEEHRAQGGRISLDTGGPPITLQRPMFNEGGLTKTIPPKRGPNPQGLPSALYNGIIRSRSY